ncbi:prepilin peptidase [Calidifontibacillus oryziterrae]|uniref:prepilin peptidase n=1 Tax=Calidifontibacillus oryziterrae TaxID=1191699 RepID=UPI00031B0275|nr:A24 family peptidase [Calidifontibacillus oryziterrae]
MDILLYIYIGSIGLIFGSFFNVVGLRVPEQQSIIKPRSHCPKCKHELTARELIPVLSYILQRGKCKSCGTKISFIYPATELLTGALFSLSAIMLGWSLELIVALLLMSLLMIVFVSDIHFMIIPDKVLFFFAPLLVIVRIFVPMTPWWSAFLGSAVGFFLLFFIAYISNGGMGGGDIKLFAVLGLALGWNGVLLALMFASLYGTIIGGIGLLSGKIKRGQLVPFGPFIVFGTITAYFFGQPIVQWYIEIISL